MNPRKNHRFFWQAMSFSLLVAVMLGSGYVAVLQAHALQEKASELQTHIAPLVYGLNDLQANFSALHTGNAVLRAQLDRQQATNLPPLHLPEAVVADVYVARINDDLQQMAQLDLGIKERVEFFGLRNAFTRFSQRHGEYRALVEAGSFDKAISYFDNLLLPSGTDLSAQLSSLLERHREQEQAYLGTVDQAFFDTLLAIAVSLGLALAACLLIAGGHLRAAWQRSHRAALYAAISEEGGMQSDASVAMLVETARELHSLASFPVNAQPVEAFAAKRD